MALEAMDEAELDGTAVPRTTLSPSSNYNLSKRDACRYILP